MPIKMVHTIASVQAEKGEEGWFSFVGRSSRNEVRLDEIATAVNHHTDSLNELIRAVNELDGRLEKLEPTKPTNATNDNAKTPELPDMKSFLEAAINELTK